MRIKDAILDWLDRHFIVVTVMPAVLLIAALTVAPAFELVSMAFIAQGGGGTTDAAEPAWAIGENLARLSSDWIFGRALLNTLLFVFSSTLAELVIGLFLALVAWRITRGKGIYRTLALLPILIPPVAIGNMWRLMYNPEFGIISVLFEAVGVGRIDLLGSGETALLAVVIVDVWHWTPFMFLILLAGLEGLPEDVVQAASVDGATLWQTVRHIVIPMLWPSIIVAFMFRSIGAFRVFDQIFLLTSGGPGVSTEVLSLYVYKVFFQQDQMSYGALLSLVTIAVVCSYLAVSKFVQARMERQKP